MSQATTTKYTQTAFMLYIRQTHPQLHHVMNALEHDSNNNFVRGNEVYDKDLNLWISYDNPREALLASLGIVHKLSSSAIDTFLNVVNDPNFDNGRCNLKEAGDIYTRVADVRREIASRRSSNPSQGSSSSGKMLQSLTAGFPLAILDLVIDQVQYIPVNNRQRSDCTMAIHPHNTRNELGQAIPTLRSMSLVHRSWTRPAQIALGKWLNLIAGASTHLPRRALASPLYGPWTKEFVCNHSRTGELELLRLLPYVLKKVPNIETLSMYFSIKRYSKTVNAPPPSFTKQLSGLVYLRDLRLDLFPMNPGLLATIWEALPRLRALSNLVLALRSYETRSDRMGWFEEVSSQCTLHLPSLQTLSLALHSPQEYTLKLASAILTLESCPVLEKLSLEIAGSSFTADSVGERFQRIVEKAEDLFKQLTTISVTMHIKHYSWDAVVPRLFSSAHKAKRICIIADCYERVSLDSLWKLPKTLEELTIVFPLWLITWGAHDDEFSAFIKEARCPALRSLTAGYIVEMDEDLVEEDEFERRDIEFGLPGTTTMCESKGVAFSRWDRYETGPLTLDWF